jgi:Na+-transporting methylmalonyl-CoA/oxaloacetate decarboxylase gamma subunit
MKNLLAIFVGGVVTLIVTALVVGPEVLAFMLLLLVMCTVGLGLIPLFFVFWLVGKLVLSFFPSESAAGPVGSAEQVEKSRRVKSLEEYILRSRQGGKDDGYIHACLKRGGWEPDEIGEAWQHCGERR